MKDLKPKIDYLFKDMYTVCTYLANLYLIWNHWGWLLWQSFQVLSKSSLSLYSREEIENRSMGTVELEQLTTGMNLYRQVLVGENISLFLVLQMKQNGNFYILVPS